MPLNTTFMRQIVSTPPRGPLTSSNRTVTRSMRVPMERSALPSLARIRASIASPRLHLRLVDDGFVVEHEADDDIAAAVERAGLPSHTYPEPHMYFGGVGAAAVSPTGDLVAAGDARREAATGVSSR